jgi:putative ABC transport system permease protein
MTFLVSRLRGRWRALTGSASAATAGLGLLVLACVLVAMAGPRASAQMQTNAVRKIIAQAPADTKAVVAAASASQLTPASGVPTVAEITGVGTELRAQMRGAPLARSSADLSSITSAFMWVNDHSPDVGKRAVEIELVHQTGLTSHARLVGGTLPSGVKPGDDASGPIFPIAVTVATAHQFGLSVGERVKVAAYRATVEVSGILRPEQPQNPFWALDPIQADPYLVVPKDAPSYWQGGALVGANEIVPLEHLVGPLNINLRWVLPLSASDLTAGQAQALAVTLPDALGQAGSDLVAAPSGPIFSATLSSGFTPLLSNFADQADAVTSLLSLLFVSLFAISAAVLLLAVWLLSEQRSADFATLQARGASRRQLAWLALRGSLPAVLVGAAIGLAVAIAATPGNDSPLGWWLSGLTLLAVLAGLPLLTMRRHRAPAVAARRRERLTGRQAEARRMVIEVVLVLAAVGGLITLRDHGIASGGTAIDPYTSLAPVLVAIPVAVVLLRCYPLAARTLLRLAGRRSGVTAFVGLARAVRTAVTNALPVFAMVLALALVAFAGMVRGAVVRGDVTVSWQQTGADAIVSTRDSISPAAQRAIAAVAGVQATAAVSLATGVFLDGNAPFGVLAADPAQYAALLSGIPGSEAVGTALASSSANHHGGFVPVLATAGIPGQPKGPRAVLETGGQQVNVRIIGQVTEVSVLAGQAGGPYLVVPRAALGAAAPAPSMDLLAGPGISHSQLGAVVKRLVPGASVSYRSSVLAGLENAPLQHGAYVAFALGSAEAGLLSLLVLLLALVLGARSRQLTLARMNTMGLSAGQGRRLVILEALPQILATLVGGVACAALLAPLTGPELDLSVFTGTGTGVPIRIEPGFLVGAALGLVALAMLTLTAQTAIASRDTVGALRIGE